MRRSDLTRFRPRVHQGAGAFDLPPATAGMVGSGLWCWWWALWLYASLYAVARVDGDLLEEAWGSLTFAVLGAYFATMLVVLPNPHGVVGLPDT